MTKFHFTSSTSPESVEAADLLKKKYGQSTPDEADCVVALGGDGLMLLTLHAFMNTGKPIYGMNRGSVGFLMNEFEEDNLDKRVEAAIATNIHPLRMTATDMEGETFSAEALNEVSMLRQSYQAAKLKIIIDGKVRMEELICDGVLVATPQGSTAYNLSAHGPILPINAPLLALTPISPFRPRRWRGALLPNRAKVEIEVLEADKRPVNAVADHAEIKGVQKISVCEDEKRSSTILFDPDHTWDERIMSEQFIT